MTGCCGLERFFILDRSGSISKNQPWTVGAVLFEILYVWSCYFSLFISSHYPVSFFCFRLLLSIKPRLALLWMFQLLHQPVATRPLLFLARHPKCPSQSGILHGSWCGWVESGEVRSIWPCVSLLRVVNTCRKSCFAENHEVHVVAEGSFGFSISGCDCILFCQFECNVSTVIWNVKERWCCEHQENWKVPVCMGDMAFTVGLVHLTAVLAFVFYRSSVVTWDGFVALRLILATSGLPPVQSIAWSRSESRLSLSSALSLAFLCIMKAESISFCSVHGVDVCHAVYSWVVVLDWCGYCYVQFDAWFKM